MKNTIFPISSTRFSNKILMGKSNSWRKRVGWPTAKENQLQLWTVISAGHLHGRTIIGGHANLCVDEGLSVKQNTSIFVDGTWFGAFAVAGKKWSRSTCDRAQYEHIKRARTAPTSISPHSPTATPRKITLKINIFEFIFNCKLRIVSKFLIRWLSTQITN